MGLACEPGLNSFEQVGWLCVVLQVQLPAVDWRRVLEADMHQAPSFKMAHGYERLHMPAGIQVCGLLNSLLASQPHHPHIACMNGSCTPRTQQSHACTHQGHRKRAHPCTHPCMVMRLCTTNCVHHYSHRSAHSYTLLSPLCGLCCVAHACMQVLVVEQAAHLPAALAQLRCSMQDPVVAIDLEWRPEFGRGFTPVAMVQLATSRQVNFRNMLTAYALDGGGLGSRALHMHSTYMA
jgi:hypothetical protein